MNATKNPLIGTPLHCCLIDLQTAQTHLGDDVKADYDAAGRLIDADAGIADAIACVRAELNRRFADLKAKAAPPAPAKPKPATVALAMPGPKGTPAVYFEKTGTGIREMLDFITEALPDGGAGILALNADMLTALSKAADGRYGQEIQSLRDAARELLTVDEAAE